MGYPETATGFMINDQKKWTEFKKQDFKLKPFEDYDIDVEIECCGVCGSDVHSITGGWGEVPLPLCVGHEVIGKAVKVGDKVKTVKVGDRVGVGAQIQACLECKICKSDNENYCPKKVDTYGAPYADGTIAQGGYSSHIRAHEYFTFPIPDNIPSIEAAPMMCAGLTTFSPLWRAKVGPGKKVAIIGLGGLGHFGVLWAKALGAEVYVISHTPSKKDDALKLGAKDFITTSSENWSEKWQFTFDFVLNTADATDKFDIPSFLSICSINGTFHHVGLPDEPMQAFKAQVFASNGCAMAGSHIGCRTEMLKMLEIASRDEIHPFIETLQISEDGCKEAVMKVKDNKVRYRFTLTGYDKVFGGK